MNSHNHMKMADRPAEPPAHDRDLIGLGGLLLLVFLVGWIAQPATVNGDGVGYLRQIPTDGLSPGHLLFLPLCRGLARHYAHRTLLDLQGPLALLCLGCGLVGLGLFWGAARRLLPPGRALPATALLAASHAFMRSALELEVYAPALMLSLGVLYALARAPGASPRSSLGWAALAGALAGLATLMHLTLALLALPLGLGLATLSPRGKRLSAPPIGLGCMGAVVGVGLLVALSSRNLLHSPSSAWAWLRSADHGLSTPLTPIAPLTALWGLCRALVFAPYPYEAPLWRVAAMTLLGGGAGLLLLGCWLRTRGSETAVPRLRQLVLAWTLPLGLFAVTFYPSDTERWIFILPLLLLLLALPPGPWVWGLCVVMALVNLVAYQVPLALDNAPMAQAAAVEQRLGSRDLLVSPGHGWDELVGLGTVDPPERFPLVFHVADLGGLGPARALLYEHIEATLARGGRVFVARLNDEQDARGFKELDRLGLPRSDYRRLFDRFSIQPTGVPDLVLLTRAGGNRYSPARPQ